MFFLDWDVRTATVYRYEIMLCFQETQLTVFSNLLLDCNPPTPPKLWHHTTLEVGSNSSPVCLLLSLYKHTYQDLALLCLEPFGGWCNSILVFHFRPNLGIEHEDLDRSEHHLNFHNFQYYQRLTAFHEDASSNLCWNIYKSQGGFRFHIIS